MSQKFFCLRLFKNIENYSFTLTVCFGQALLVRSPKKSEEIQKAKKMKSLHVGRQKKQRTVAQIVFYIKIPESHQLRRKKELKT